MLAKWKLVSCGLWWLSMTSSCPMMKLQQDNTAISAMRVKRSVDCPVSGATMCHRDKRDAPGKAAERWSGFGSQLDVARPCGRSALGGLGPHGGKWRGECALASAGRCTPCGRGHTISDAAVPKSEVSAPKTITYDQAWTPMKRLASVVKQTPEETTMAEDGA